MGRGTMKKILFFDIVLLAGLLLSVGRVNAAPAVPESGTDQACLRCHAQTTTWKQWTHSAHYKAGLTCTMCHKGADKPDHKAADVSKPACTDCHYYWKDKAAEFKDSIHAKKGLNCTSCHNPHADTAMAPANPRQFAKRCTRCHKGNVLKLHAFMPHADMHLSQQSCFVCHSDVHTVLSKKDNTVTCSSCHPGKTLVKKVLPRHKAFFPRIALHMRKLNCEDCHRPKGPIKTCSSCHSEKSILARAQQNKNGWITDEPVLQKYGYMVGTNHVKWLDIIGILMFAGALAVWVFHGGLRILAAMMRKGGKR